VNGITRQRLTERQIGNNLEQAREYLKDSRNKKADMKKHPALLIVLLLSVMNLSAQSPLESASTNIRIEQLPSGSRYAIIGERQEKPAPLLLMIQGSLENALAEPIYTEAARLLAQKDFITVLIDAPAHGTDARSGEKAELAAWSERIGLGEDLLTDFLGRVRELLDALVQQKVADPSRIAVAGTSRGGFLAFHVAAFDPRVRCAAGISPVTELLRLREFASCARKDSAEQLSLVHLTSRLVSKPAWISMGNHDERVGTDAAINFARRLTAANIAHNGRAPVDLVVHSTPGHRSTKQDHVLLAAWLEREMALDK